MEVRQAYACESFEWDQLRRIVERDGQAANVSLLRGRVRPHGDILHATCSAYIHRWRAMWGARGKASMSAVSGGVQACHPCMSSHKSAAPYGQ